MSFAREPGSEPLPGYELVELLGSGGYGEVWKCIAPGELYKAIKFVYGNLNALDADGARAEQELNALGRIKEVRHPFVLSNERIDLVDGEVVIVMELADKSLHDALGECQASGLVGIPRDDLLRYLRDAAEALDHMLDKHNLLHLDIKPRNLFLVSDRVKVADFGLVEHLERTSLSGMLGGVTPLYAPPETINNKISPQSDQYSLAIVYQELLTGQRPFSGKNARQLAMQHLHEPPDLRPLPLAERPVVARALAKDPLERWPTCLSFVRALYNARKPARVQTVQEEETTAGSRPKTLADTMEDIMLEARAGASEPLPAGAEEPVGELKGTTVAQQSGALRPTLVLGLGQFGRRALLELRCRFLDRFGDLAKIPLVRLLYVDSDAEAIKAALRGTPEVALGNGAVCHLPLQPVGNYRRRILDHLSEWLPREKLYSMPRSLQAQGCRALGRLAFTDNHLRLITRLRRALQQATHPDVHYQSVTQSGLALRDAVPRVYVIAAAGGSSSGMLVDLGYSLRTLLNQLKFPNADVVAFLLCGAPSDPATPAQEQANVYACLTELNHFDDPAAPFAAQYAPDAARIRAEGKPFTSTYLFQLEQRSPEALRDVVAHLGSFVFHDLTTPLGARLERRRRQTPTVGASPFRSFGTFAVWFPRGLFLRLASRQACARLLAAWEATGEPTDSAAVRAACNEALGNQGLRFENICSAIEDAAQVPAEGKLSEAMTGFLWQLEEQAQSSLAQEDVADWSGQAVQRLKDWVGKGAVDDSENAWRQGRLGRALTTAFQQVASQWDAVLAEAAFAQMDRGGKRLAAAEHALWHFMDFCQTALRAARVELQKQVQQTQALRRRLEQALKDCQGGGGFSFFGGGSRRLLRAFMDQLAAFARQQLSQLICHGGMQLFGQLYCRLEERLRETTFCRQRLRHLRASLESSEEESDRLGELTPSSTPLPSPENYWETIRESATVHVVLPEGETDLDRCALNFVQHLTEEQWAELDLALYEKVLAPLGGLHPVCVGGSDLRQVLGTPLTQEAAVGLGQRLPTTDVAEVESSAAAAAGTSPEARTRAHFARAMPLIAGSTAADQQAFLLVPASEAGKNLGEEAKKAIPDLHVVRVPGQADLMFCREQGNLAHEDIQRLLQPFRAAYDQLAATPNTSPHARFDVTDWVPLDT